MPGKRGCFRTDTFHQIAIRNNGINEMINNFVFSGVKFGSQMRLSNRHTDAIGKTLPKRAGGGIHARCQTKFGMPRSKTAPLAEITHFIQGKFIAGEMK